MKFALQASLIGALLAVSLLFVLSAPALAETARLVGAVSEQLPLTLPNIEFSLRLSAMLLVGTIGLVVALTTFTLVPTVSTRSRRLIHVLGIVALFLIGYFLLGTLEWGTITEQAQQFQNEQLNIPLDLPVLLPVLPYAVLAAFGAVGYLLLLVVVRPLPAWNITDAHERLLCRIQQTRLKHPLTPDNLIATDQRLIVFRPSYLGFIHSTDDEYYRDIATVTVRSGLLFSTVQIKSRFQGKDLEFKDMNKWRAREFRKVVNEQVRLERSGEDFETLPSPPTPANIATMRILQERLARGEISVAEYDKLLRKLSPGG